MKIVSNKKVNANRYFYKSVLLYRLHSQSTIISTRYGTIY